ncbi:MAG: PQQ-dependent sugar dehydrogenase [Akkermansiaceae bacterium]|nr:PQQ-dependent sugar dehydrogenase [Akkermansiaceae bacterium]
MSGWTTANAFPNLTFFEPLHLSPIPGSSQMLLVCKNGRIFRFGNSPSTTQAGVVQVLDWASKTQTGEDMGFYSLVFHPEFGQEGSPNADYVYVCYNHRPAAPLTGQSAFNSYWTVSRFTWQRGTGTLNPASEYVLIRQYDPHSWHNGGAMFFGPDGFLYITNGDGGNDRNFYNYSQRIDFGLFAGILRIDVDNDPAKSHPIRRQPQSGPQKPAAWPASYTQGYGIPNDNPWQAEDGSVLEEFYAIGVRSPHSAHYDIETGDIWVGDVGQEGWEEMNRMRKGDNAQWAYREGNQPGPQPQPGVIIGNSLPPEITYPHTLGNACVIGGMRYRGAKWANELGGKLLYADHISRR